MYGAPGLLYVGPDETIKNIQEAVDYLVPGGTVIVRDGTYTENIVVDKGITIRSENGYAHTTVVAENPVQPVFQITDGSPTIEGFSLYGATGAKGIEVLTTDGGCTISGNRIGLNDLYYNQIGIYVWGYGGHTITNNRLLGNTHTGILLDNTSGNLLQANYCSGNDRGISLYGAARNRIVDNTCHLNPIIGIYLTSSNSTRNELRANVCTQNGNGFEIHQADDNLMWGNLASGNHHGIHLRQGANRNLIWDNEFSDGSGYGILLDQSDDNRIFLNDISSNSLGNVQSYDAENVWHTPADVLYYHANTLPATGQNVMGNYYSDHITVDLDADGIDDTAYVLPGSEPEDTAPLVSPRAAYNFHVRNCHPNHVISAAENVAALGSLTVLSDPADTAAVPLLTIEGKLSVGDF